MSRTNVIIEIIFATLILFVFVFLFQATPLAYHLGSFGLYAVPGLCILIPWLIITIKKESFTNSGIHLENFSHSLLIGLFTSTILLVPYFIIYAFWFDVQTMDVSDWPKLTRWVKMSLYQIFYVALPEEFFFRGYLQTRLNGMYQKPFDFLGTHVGWGLPVTALVFMAFHLVQAINIWTLGVFFPALIFGWLREKTGSITAPIVFHALSNILLFTFQANY